MYLTLLSIVNILVKRQSNSHPLFYQSNFLQTNKPNLFSTCFVSIQQLKLCKCVNVLDIERKMPLDHICFQGSYRNTINFCYFFYINVAKINFSKIQVTSKIEKMQDQLDEITPFSRRLGTGKFEQFPKLSLCMAGCPVSTHSDAHGQIRPEEDEPIFYLRLNKKHLQGN